MKRKLKKKVVRLTIYEKIVDKLLTEDLKEIASDAEVSITTLINWTTGKTIAPRISTLYKVANVLGYDIVLYMSVVKPKLRIVK